MKFCIIERQIFHCSFVHIAQLRAASNDAARVIYL